jgi:hypothetical protein
MVDATPPWHVKYEGPCARCGRPLMKGEVAIWDRGKRQMRCIECPSVESSIAEPGIDVGIAGGSARREYERRLAKRDDAVRDKFGRLGGVVLALTAEPQSTRAWAIGARGEEKLAEALGEVERLQVLNDRRVSGTRGNIDHIVIAPAGVFVVDAKNYQGMVRVRDRGGLFRTDLRLYVGRRDCSSLAVGMNWQVEAVASALAAADGESAPQVTPVLCFIDAEWPLIRAPGSYAGVLLESVRSLRKLLTASAALDAATIDRLSRHLARALPAK